ncbi:MAG: PP2C family protein-serine/threonine phosphatase [Planctomycetota bacterium]|jgi:sigma-B regulation protein RsbU (phosphoserine phosphatase)
MESPDQAISRAAGGDPVPELRRVDTSGNPRIPVLMEMVGALSRARGPRDVLKVFSSREELYGPRGYVSVSTRGLPPGHYRMTDVIDLAGSYDLALADPLLNIQELPVHRGGFFGRIIGTTFPELFHHLDVRNDPVVGDALAGYRSLMSIPLLDDGEPVNWTVFLRQDPEGFSVDDLEQAILRVNLVGTAVKNALIARDLHRAHAQIRDEVEHIAAIQRALLPQPIPDIPGLSIAASYQTFDQAGGDYYDFRPLRRDDDGSVVDPNGPWSVLISDASGHGPAAAVVMAMLHAILHAYPHQQCGPAEMLEHANQHLASKRIENSFVTAFLAVYDPTTRRLTYARAGHDPPLFRSAGTGASIRRLDDVGGAPLGVLSPMRYDEATVLLQPGQTLLLYTDGVTDARGPDGSMFGVGGIERALASCAGEPGRVVASIADPLSRHEGGIRPGDDQTIVAIRAEAA